VAGTQFESRRSLKLPSWKHKEKVSLRKSEQQPRASQHSRQLWPPEMPSSPQFAGGEGDSPRKLQQEKRRVSRCQLRYSGTTPMLIAGTQPVRQKQKLNNPLFSSAVDRLWGFLAAPIVHGMRLGPKPVRCFGHLRSGCACSSHGKRRSL